MLAKEYPAKLIFFDLLGLGTTNLTGKPFGERRQALSVASMTLVSGPTAYARSAATEAKRPAARAISMPGMISLEWTFTH
jgi:ATP-dependent DNA ligase